MIKLATTALMLIALTACQKTETETHSTTVATSTDRSGVMTTNKVVLTNYAMRAALGNNPNTAAYVTIENKGDSPERLISATCACAAKATLHTMTMTNGTMDMEEAEHGFTIAPGQTLTFSPGGNHIMLEGLTTRPADGQIVDVNLTFEKAGTVTLAMPVSSTPLAKESAPDNHDHMKM